MVKTRKNKKKQRGGGIFGFFNKPSCMTEVSNYMTKDFETDNSISSLSEKMNKIETCKVSNDTGIEFDKLDNYSIQIS